jgi:hypothetical protein
MSRRSSLSPHLFVLSCVVLGASVCANLSPLKGSRFLPPFRDGWDTNMVDHLGGEYLNIARSIASGDDFGSPFGDPTGPTAWMPPAYPTLLAALLLTLGDEDAVAFCVVALQDLSLIYAGWVVLDAARRTTARPGGPAVALTFYIAWMFYHFHSWFQFTHDSWLVLLCVSLLFHGAGHSWDRAPSRATATLWGLGGGASALVSPVLALPWAAVAVVTMRRRRPFAWSLLVAALVVAPWTARNYWVFHRLIPVKSNAYYELYQSSCLEPSGVLRHSTGVDHPYRNPGPERWAYADRGEIAYLDDYRVRFREYLRERPLDFAAKVGNRLLAATILYFPYDDDEAIPLWANALLHPLPIWGLAAMLVVGRGRLDPTKIIALVVYLTYLTPYVLAAYYERYALPLTGVQALWCYWGWDAIWPSASRCRAGPGQASPGRG